MSNQKQTVSSAGSLPSWGRAGVGLLSHYLKMAFRNLRKYKTQNIISIIGLAVGFVCFAFSALWIRYEMSYDNFHAKADRIYRVNALPFKWDTMGGSVSEVQTGNSYQLTNWLKSNFPEIEEACAAQIRVFDKDFSLLYTDYDFCRFFDIDLPEDLFVAGQTDKPVAITNEINNEEIKEVIKEKLNYDAKAAFSSWPANTNIRFNIAIPLSVRAYPDALMKNWSVTMFDTYIRVKDDADIDALRAKLDKVNIPEWKNIPVSFILTPLQQLRYKDPTGMIQSDVKFGHIQIFAIAGLMVILCSLFNHMTLYVTRVRMRLRELALRKVNGATDWQIAATLYTDFLLVILLSLIAGFMLIALLLPTFKEYAGIGSNNVTVYFELMFYAVLLIVCGFVAGGIPVLYFRKHVLDESIKGSGSPGSRDLFRKASLLLQLLISLGMIFCTAVFIKQLHFLYRSGLGINRHNIASVEPPSYSQLPPQYVDRIKQVPGVIDAIPVRYNAFLRNITIGPTTIIVEKDGQKINYAYYLCHADARFFDFFGVEIIEGVGFSNETNNKIVVNETMMKDLGKEVISTHFDVAGVARDFYLTPTTKPRPIAFLYPKEHFFTTIAYRYEEGFRQQIEEATEKMIREDFPEYKDREIYRHRMEDIFEEHFKSERALLTLLSVMTFACILIAIFGVYSLTSLTCQQRRREIAVRKINGAEELNIMNIFFKEYLLLLAIAALIAFPAGYVIMKRWLDSYVKQTSMDGWLFVLIFLIVFVVIVFSIVTMVWKAANQNPAEVVKSE